MKGGKNMRIACIGNAVYDFTVSSNEYIKKGVRTSFYDPIYSVGGPASNAAAVIATTRSTTIICIKEKPHLFLIISILPQILTQKFFSF